MGGRRVGLGDLVLHAAVPFPGLADVGYLGFPLGAVLGIALFPTDAARADRRRMTLDGLMVATESRTPRFRWTTSAPA